MTPAEPAETAAQRSRRLIARTTGPAAISWWTWLVTAPFALTVPFWPLGAGLALALLAAAFRAGERLRRDTEGLV